jgi:ion channel-forming bestrophin family protein
MFFRIYGSVFPNLLIPMSLVAIWSVVWTKLLKTYFQDKIMDSILITVLGFLVGIAISFRNTTAYERYNEGRKYWSQLHLTTTNLARVIWVHCKEREGTRKEDLLAKV